MFRVVMVCLGNICRSPIAAAVLADRVQRAGLDVSVASAGTGGWHAGDNADPRARAALRARGYVVHHAAQQFTRDWFDRYDLVVAMDQHNVADLLRLRSDASVHLLREWDPEGSGDVPDPYYGGAEGFDEVVDMAERSCDGLVAWMQTTGRARIIAPAT